MTSKVDDLEYNGRSIEHRSSGEANAKRAESMKGLQYFPAEIILCVFDALGNIPDAERFSTTASKIYLLWKIHAASISEKLMSDQITCYPEARLLAECQEKYLYLPSERPHHSDTKYRRVTRLYHRLISNASAVSRIPDLFQECITFSGLSYGLPSPKPILTIHERTCIQRAYYRMWTCAVVSESPDVPQKLILDHMPFQDFYPLFQVIELGTGQTMSPLTQPCLDVTCQQALLVFHAKVGCTLRCLFEQSLASTPGLRMCQCLSRIDLV